MRNDQSLCLTHFSEGEGITLATKFKEGKENVYQQRQKPVLRICANVCVTFQLPPNFSENAKQDTLLMCCNLPMKVKATQSCATLCDPMDYIVRGILQARILEWVAFPLSRGSFQPRDRTQVSLIAGRFFTS